MKAQEDLNGQIIDRYQIIEHLASGGMADVYVARDVELQRLVALKIMSASLAANEEYVERFRREAQAVARLEHPNIVQIFSAGVTSSGRPYLAMQYVGGGSLQERIQELQAEGHAFSSVAALSITEKLADALEVAHRAGIVHRDIKPSNILLREDGEPVLVDLGIAAIEGAARLTRTGNLVGTPHYMSPEQVRGLTVDGRSDIYSLGIILFEMLAGQVPFDAPESLAILHQHVNQAPPNLNELRPGLSAESYEVVATCLAKDPGNRYQSAAAFKAALASTIAAEQAGRPIITPTMRLPQAPLANRRRLLALGVLLILLLPLTFLTFRFLTAEPLEEEVNPTVVALSLTITSQASFAGSELNNPEPGSEAAAVATSTFAPTVLVTEAPAATSTVAATETFVPSPTVPPPTETTAPTVTTPATATSAPTSTIPSMPVSCAVAAAANFTSSWETNRERIGCATGNASSGVSMAEESFERGRMFWRSDNDQIYVVYSSGTWAGYDDIWNDGDPSFSCGAEQSPPTPQRGFGKIWCTHGSVQQGLGNATEAEYALSGTVQNFDNGFMLQTSSGRTYVFFYDGTWR